MCAIIIKGESLREHEKIGFNICSPDWKEGMEDWDDEKLSDILKEENMCGLDKLFPCGPTCEYNGKTVPCFISWTNKGSITGTLLAEMLKLMDKHELFDRSDGIDPFLLLDGHGSRFEAPFVEYIHGKNEGKYVWTVTIGVPYGTNLWQVGDSIEQNGSFKFHLKEAKELLLV